MYALFRQEEAMNKQNKKVKVRRIGTFSSSSIEIILIIIVPKTNCLIFIIENCRLREKRTTNSFFV
jgi:hypothetical protein